MENNERLTMTIPEVAKALGISKALAYDLAKRDELPVKVLRLGQKRIFVPRIAFEKVLTDAGNRIQTIPHDIHFNI
ncbi:MAG: helix-turn-helix domain-containing protein [Dehalococcoidia bacterium]|jgi:predicted DNA-binding transcriptional regulator AlpA